MTPNETTGCRANRVSPGDAALWRQTGPSAPAAWRRWVAVLLAGAWLLPAGAAASVIRNLSDNSCNDWLQSMDDGQVVWLSDLDGDDEPESVVFHDGTTAITLSDNTGEPAWSAMVSHGQVVWEGTDGTDTEVYLYRNGATTNLSDNDCDDREVWLSDGQVVWSSYTNYVQDGNNFYYPMALNYFDGTQTVVLASGGGPGDASIDCGQIVWRQWGGADEEVFLYRDGVITNLSNRAGRDRRPRIRGGQVLWECDTDGDYNSDQLLLYDGTQTVVLASGVEPREARLDNGDVVWRQGEDEAAEIYLYHDGQTTNLSSNGMRDDDPWLSEGQVVWQTDTDGDGYTDTRLFYDGVTTGLAEGWGDGWGARIDRGRVAWQQWDDSDSEIYCTDLRIPVIRILPEGHNFGPILLGQSVTQEFLIVNAGITNLLVGSVSLADGPHLASFAIRDDAVTGRSLAPGATGTLSVVFTPVSLWGKAVVLQIPSNDPDSPTNTLRLYGTGIDDTTAETRFQEGLAFLRDYAAGSDTNALFAADQGFTDALAADPDHYGACLFGSITRFLTVVHDPEMSQMLTDFGFPVEGRDLLDWTAAFPEAPATNTPSSGKMLNLLSRKLIPVIDNALANLARVPTNWSGSVVVTPGELPIDNEVEVDAGDLQMLQAGLEAFKALLLAQGGYDFDFDFAYLDHLDTPRAAITVDGNAGDWAGLEPLLVDPQDGAGTPNTDVHRVFTAMDSANAYLMIETHGMPIDPTVAVEVNVNFKPGCQWDHGDHDDLNLNIAGREVGAWTNNFTPVPLGGTTVAWGSVLEVAIPLAELGNPSYFAATFVNTWLAGDPGVDGSDPSDVPQPPLSAYLARFPRFGTVTNVAAIASASNGVIRAIDCYLAGAALIRAETDYQPDDFIVFDPEGADAERRARLWLTQIRDSVTRRVSASFAAEFGQFVDLGDCFTNPVAPRSFATGGGVRQVLLNQGLYQLDFALAHLAGVGAGFNLLLSPADSPLVGADTEIDDGDILMARAGLTFAKALVNLAGSYELECDLAKLAESDPILATEFIEAHPRFLTLSNTAFLAASSNFLPAALDGYLAASRAIRNELDDQADDLIVIAPDSLVQEAKTCTVLEGLRDSMTGTVLVANSDVHEYIHLGRLFVPGYVTRAHLPRFTGANEAEEGSFPDPTFNGVLPSNTQWHLSWLLGLQHADADADAMPDLWEQDAFGTLTNTPSGDNDHDGQGNYAEYVTGTSPRDGRSVLAMDPLAVQLDGAFTLRWLSAPYGNYQVYRSTNLTEGFFLLEPRLPATPPTNVYSDLSTGGGLRFYRVGVEARP